MIPQGYVVNNYLTDPDAFFIKTDVPNGLNIWYVYQSKLPWKAILKLVT